MRPIQARARVLLLPLATLAAGLGCTQPAPAPAPLADAGPAEPPPLANKSGERLKIRVERGDDGSQHVLEVRFDSKYKERCMDSCGSDGKWRCLPADAEVMDSYYADKDCTQRIARVVKGRAAPPHAVLESKDKLTGAGWGCEYDPQNRVFKVEGEYRESYLYLKNEKSGGCAKCVFRPT